MKFYSFLILIRTVNELINRILFISTAAEFNLFMHALDLKIFLAELAIWDCNLIWGSIININTHTYLMGYIKSLTSVKDVVRGSVSDIVFID